MDARQLLDLIQTAAIIISIAAVGVRIERRLALLETKMDIVWGRCVTFHEPPAHHRLGT